MTQAICERATLILGNDNRLSLRFISADHEQDIARREAVIGIRNNRPEQIGLACRKVGRIRFAGYAVNDTLRPWVRVMGKTPSALWLAANTDLTDSLEVVTPRNALDLAITGVARALLPTFIGDRQEGLVRVTPPIQELEHDQWLVMHHEERFVPDVRRTIDRIHDVLVDLHRQHGADK
jgi:DNA-binding transcriptional LysR family regulator